MKEKFLKEYEQLCLKYRMFINACGCCGSPFLTIDEEMTEDGSFERELLENIEHLQGEE